MKCSILVWEPDTICLGATAHPIFGREEYIIVTSSR